MSDLTITLTAEEAKYVVSAFFYMNAWDKPEVARSLADKAGEIYRVERNEFLASVANNEGSEA